MIGVADYLSQGELREIADILDGLEVNLSAISLKGRLDVRDCNGERLGHIAAIGGGGFGFKR
jgi:hypothetical protein